MIGPLIDGASKERVQAAIELGRREGEMAAEIPVPGQGFYVSPTILTDLPPDSRILKEEIFGPLLAVGNLYINRGFTGALVGRQPFGGFRMSGVGSKADGPDYLLQFMEPRVITENTMRRGYSPDIML